ncbi:MAG TPA: GNAT family N-acetyltransferase [Pyrinomonadaceae bacterium]|nr:GNAT family N-acetyltransferase [Pyrinomonadaceae bacterium]
MRVNSKGFLTDLFFWRSFGRVTDRGEYMRVETPTQRGWYFGNLLLFARGPADGDLARWRELYAREFAHAPEIRHELFCWPVEDETVGAVEPFIAAGFTEEVNPVLVARTLKEPPRPNREIEVREVTSEEDWREAVEAQVLSRGGRFDEARFRDFIGKRIDGYRCLIAEGKGAWYGAYLGGRLVADLGFFWGGPSGRFQYVETHPDFRRRGICATLVYEVGAAALREGRAEELVISAESEDVARIYESVGFKEVGRSAALIRYPEEK